MTTASRPLEGVTVVALEHAVAAPFATRQLADLGARVIKVERPGTGDFARGYDRRVEGQSSHFVWLNRGKESLELDLKDPQDRQLLDRLLEGADVLVTNLGPGVVDRLGLGAAALRERQPRLIHCSITGYGPGGPYGTRKAYDLLVQCETGVLSITGTPEEPVRAGMPVADIAAGMYAHSGILTALYRRLVTGEGATLHVSMIDALGEWMTQPALFTAGSDEPPRRTGARHPSIAPYGPFRCGDGSTIFLAVQNDREWAALCAQVLARPDLTLDGRFHHNPDRVAHLAELDAVVLDGLGRYTVEEALAALDAAGIANARMRSAEDLLDHPQLVARDRWRDVEIPGGTARALLPPVTVEGSEPAMYAVPGLGQHNDAIRAELGLGPTPPGAST